jgi:hypothetical protein
VAASSILAGCVLALGFSVTAGSGSGTVSQAAIDSAVQRGVAHLLALYADGEGKDVGLPDARPTLNDRPGLRALVVYALLKSGVDDKHPVVEKLLARLAADRFDHTYDAALMLLVLQTLDPVRHRAWIAELASNLLAYRTGAGEFGYPGGHGDLSNTQYGALALRAAASAGVEIRAEVWTGIADAVLRHRTPEGGFDYAGGRDRSSGSMTVAGVGTLALCEEQLANARALTPELASRYRRAREQGLHWLAQRFAVDRNPGSAAFTHYYLYGLERMGALAGIDRVGEHDWYREGAGYLLSTQLGDGSWAGTFEREATPFALLFLRRATAVQVATHAMDPAPAHASPDLFHGTHVPAPPESATPAEKPGNLLEGSRSRATSSSVLAGEEKYPARAAVDGNPRTPWIAAQGDESPWLKITLPSSVRASRVRIVPATIFPRTPEFLTRPLGVAVRINGEPAVEGRFPAGSGAALELRLERPVTVESLELRLLGREQPGKSVGIGEVELALSEP